MKTVKSADHLKRLAFARGASVSVGGKQFNSTAERVDLRQPAPPAKPEPEPKPEPKPEPAVAAEPPAPVDLAPIMQGAVDAMAASVQTVAADNARVMAEICRAMERLGTKPAEAADLAKHWRLIFNRNPRGLMETADIVRVA